MWPYKVCGVYSKYGIMAYTSFGRDLMSWWTSIRHGEDVAALSRGIMVGKSECFSVLVCGIWTFLRDHIIYSRSQILRYKEKNYNILIVCFGIHWPQNLCNACAAKIGLYLMNQLCLCHYLKWDMCMGALSAYNNLFLVDSMSGSLDIHLPFQHTQTLQRFCGSLYLLWFTFSFFAYACMITCTLCSTLLVILSYIINSALHLLLHVLCSTS